MRWIWVLLLIGCEDSASTPECVYNSDCPETQICANGACAPECREHRDCTEGLCEEGACRAPADAIAADGRVLDALPRDAALDGPLDAVAAQDAAPRPMGQGHLGGQVHFRLFDESVLPVARPIVYWTFPEDRPPPLQRGANCDCGYPPTAVRGEVDGRFELRNLPAGPIWLVLQKGAFRRIQQVEVLVDALTALPLEATELPIRHAPEEGLEMPRIVVGTGRFDPIEDIFAKLRIGPITPTFHFDYVAWMADPEAWDIDLALYQQPRVLDDDDALPLLEAPGFLELLSGGELAAYDFAFAPCAEYRDYGAWLTSERNRDALRRYVNGGGKLYVTDFAYDLAEQVWPGYVDFLAPEGRDGNADGHVGDPDFMSVAAVSTLRYESHNRAHDETLAAWLAELGASADGTLLTEGNWVNVEGVGTEAQCCREGMPVEVTPQVVMSGPNGVDPFIGDFGPSHDRWDAAEAEGANHPHTLRFPYGCGEVMYSTYHTVEGLQAQANITPQELVLLYLILEINECNLNPIKE